MSYFSEPSSIFHDIIAKLKDIQIGTKFLPKLLLRPLGVIFNHGFRLQDYSHEPISLRIFFPGLRKIGQEERIIYLVRESFWNRMPIVPNQSTMSLGILPNSLKSRNKLVPSRKPVEE